MHVFGSWEETCNQIVFGHFRLNYNMQNLDDFAL